MRKIALGRSSAHEPGRTTCHRELGILEARTDSQKSAGIVLTPGNRRTYDRLGKFPHFLWKRRRPVLR